MLSLFLILVHEGVRLILKTNSVSDLLKTSASRIVIFSNQSESIVKVAINSECEHIICISDGLIRSKGARACLEILLRSR